MGEAPNNFEKSGIFYKKALNEGDKLFLVFLFNSIYQGLIIKKIASEQKIHSRTVESFCQVK